MAIINDKAALLGAASKKQESIAVTGGEVLVTELGAVDYLRMLDDARGDSADVPYVALVASWATVDESGNRLLTPEEFCQLDRSTQFVIGGAAMRINGLVPEEEGKNSEASTEDDSLSGSLST